MAEVLSADEIQERMQQVPEWESDDSSISRTFEFDGYMEGIEFVNRVAAIAEELNHHPDLDVRYGWVDVSLTSHDVGGITERDFAAAQRIDALVPG